ncbi:hypothetical protein [uncultured Gammaproteobacteria bacterium]|nr:hypothetical protein [uncultured Gammaproteobacteria bacterium]
MCCWIKSSFVDLDGWKNGGVWFGLGWFLRGDYLKYWLIYIHFVKFGENFCVLVGTGFEWGKFFGFDCGFGFGNKIIINLDKGGV